MIPAGHTSVMASRREPPNSLEFFPTPPWATRALLSRVLPSLIKPMPRATAWDPACGEGHMSEVLAESFETAFASDIFDYGCGYQVADFLDPTVHPAVQPDAIITNPPFAPAVQFAERALELAPVVALLLRTNWLEGIERYQTLFRRRPLTLYAPFVERVPMVKGRWDPKASTATAYAWFVWVDGVAPRPLFQIPPGCREALTRPDDVRRFAVRSPAPLLDAAE